MPKPKTCYHKTPRRKHRHNTLSHNHSNVFLDLSPKAKQIKAKMIRWDIMELKSLTTAKESAKTKRQPTK